MKPMLGVLATSILFLSSCKTAPNSPASIDSGDSLAVQAPKRCPATEAECKALLTRFGKIVEIKVPHPIATPISIVSFFIAKNIRRMEIPFSPNDADLKDPKFSFEKFQALTVETTMTQFIRAYQSFKGGNELLMILSDAAPQTKAHLRSRVDKWALEFLPGYKLRWPVIGEDDFIEEPHFFNMLDQKIIPIANHHDILAHLFLFLDPELRDLTERLSSLYSKALKLEPKGTSGTSLPYLINYFWVRLQEHTPIKYYDENEAERIAIIGGFPSLAAPLAPVIGHIINYVYLKEDVAIHFGRLQDKIEMSKATNRELLLRTHQELIELVRESIGLAKNASEIETSQRLNRLSRELDDEYEAEVLNYVFQDRWKAFSKRILKGEGHPGHRSLRPEVHRKIMTLSIEILEGLLNE